MTQGKTLTTARLTLSKRLLRTKEAAVYLGFSAWQIRRLVQEGELPIVQCCGGENGRHWRIDVYDLDRFIERHKRTSF